jgi:hypothetical protein
MMVQQNTAAPSGGKWRSLALEGTVRIRHSGEWVFGFGVVLPVIVATLRHGAFRVGKGVNEVKKVRDLEFLLAQLRALRDRNDTEPEQTKNIDDAIELVRQLRRKSHPTGPEVARLVRKIADALFRAFVK